MSTRITHSIAIQKARQSLLRLLFPHRTDAASSHSHAELRAAYLAKAQTMHPDKLPADEATQRASFVRLKHAWEEYDALAKRYRVTSRRDDRSDAGSFTMFGVGCSFDDNPREREYRREITDMACRGWISSGSLAAGDVDDGSRCDVRRGASGGETSEGIGICDEDWFVVGECRGGVGTGGAEASCMKSLVRDFDKFKRRSSRGDSFRRGGVS